MFRDSVMKEERELRDDLQKELYDEVCDMDMCLVRIPAIPPFLRSKHGPSGTAVSAYPVSRMDSQGMDMRRILGVNPG